MIDVCLLAVKNFYLVTSTNSRWAFSHISWTLLAKLLGILRYFLLVEFRFSPFSQFHLLNLQLVLDLRDLGCSPDVVMGSLIVESLTAHQCLSFYSCKREWLFCPVLPGDDGRINEVIEVKCFIILLPMNLCINFL